MDQKLFASIPPARREMYLRIVGNVTDVHPITHRLHFLDTHFPPNKLDKALSWLCKNNVTGDYFVKWFRQYCSNSDLEMVARLLRIVDNAPILPVVAGRNFRL
jgi:hypothetical protein